MIFHYHHTPIYYRIEGKGPALVLLHGFLESSSIWERWISFLRKYYTVIVLDFPGHGKSDPLPAVLSMEVAADIVYAILRKEGIETFRLLGHSMGGYIALALIEQQPEKVQSVFLLNSTAAADTTARKANRNKALELLPKNKRLFVRTTLNALFSEEAERTHKDVIEALIDEAITFPTKGIQGAIEGMRDRKDRTSVLENFSKTKIIIAGNQDPIIPLEHIRSLAKGTDSELKIVEGGHMCWLENWETIVKIVHFNE